MHGPTRSGRFLALVNATVALTAAVMLLSSALLAAGAHEHLASFQPEVVCTIDHADSPAPRPGGVHGTERAHRHHCASCQLAAKSTQQRPAASSLFERPTIADDLAAPPAPDVRAAHDVAAPPRGPPIS